MGAGVLTPKGEMLIKSSYQGAHHQLVASALAIKLGHEIIQKIKLGVWYLEQTNISIYSKSR